MYQFKFADIGEGIHEAIITNFHVKENQSINEGDVLISVETDKVTTDITSPVTGIIKKSYFQTSDKIFVGDILFEIEEEKSQIDKQNINQIDQKNEESVSVVGSLTSSEQIIPNFHLENIAVDNKAILISPLARKLAIKNKIDLKTVVGTGPNSRILLDDIEKIVAKKSQDFLSTNIDQIINEQEIHNEVAKKVEVSMIRQTIAQAMIKTKQTIPEAVMFSEVDVSLLVKLRATLNKEFHEKKIHLTYLPFIIKALGLALKKHEQFNSTFDITTNTITYKYFYNIGIAVDGPNGLVVPVLKNVDQYSLEVIAEKLQNIINKVKEKTLNINDLKNGTFSITNYGALGIYYGTPIINYPESAILGIGKIDKHIKVMSNNAFVIKDILPLSLTIDHRIIDGGDGGRFLQTLSNLLENPELLL